MKPNTSIPFTSTVYDQDILQNLDLQNTAVLEILTTIQSEIIDSEFFVRKFGEYKFYNSYVGMRKWKRNEKKKVVKATSYDIKTEADAIDDNDREMIKNEWIAHVLEHGEQVEGENGASQHYKIDVGIVVCKKDDKKKNVSFASRQDVPRIITDSFEEMSSITSLTSSSKKKRVVSNQTTCSLHQKGYILL